MDIVNKKRGKVVNIVLILILALLIVISYFLFTTDKLDNFWEGECEYEGESYRVGETIKMDEEVCIQYVCGSRGMEIYRTYAEKCSTE